MTVALNAQRTAGEIAQIVGAEVLGDAGVEVTHIATLADAKAGGLAFLANSKYRKHLATTAASVVLLKQQFADDCPTTSLIVKDPYLAYAKITQALFPAKPAKVGIHASAVVSDDASIGEGCEIGPHVVIESGASIGDNVRITAGAYIGENVVVGSDSVIHANASIYADCKVGERALIHSSAVIGSDGFGFANDSGSWVKVKQLGAVVLGDDVEVGANTSIDRGALMDTVIGNGVKLDNQIQVAHNVTIGDDSALAACVGLAGSTHIGKRCTIGGGAGFSGHLTLTDDVHVTGFTMVTRTIEEPGLYSSGITANDNVTWRKNHARFHQLDKLAKTIKSVEKSVAEMKDTKTKED